MERRIIPLQLGDRSGHIVILCVYPTAVIFGAVFVIFVILLNATLNYKYWEGACSGLMEYNSLAV